MSGILAALALLFGMGSPEGDVPVEDLAVIVHPERLTEVTPGQLAQIYLKKRRFWPDGEQIVPVNRESESFEREIFNNVVFGSLAENLRVYWNRQYFLGVFPPATLATDDAIKEFVARERYAIGYIRASAVDDSVQVAMRLPADPTGPAATH